MKQNYFVAAAIPPFGRTTELFKLIEIFSGFLEGFPGSCGNTFVIHQLERVGLAFFVKVGYFKNDYFA